MTSALTGALILLAGVLILGTVLGHTICRLIETDDPEAAELAVPMLLLLAGLTLVAWGIAP